MDDNGTGTGGGNSSVWWEIRHGSSRRPQQLTVAGPSAAVKDAAAPGGVPVGVTARAAAGEVRVTNTTPPGSGRVEIHDRTDLRTVGAPDHTGMFRVRLRIKRAVMEQLIAAETDPARKQELAAYWAALPGVAAALQPFTGAPQPRADEAWEDTTGDVFIVVDVPAIERKPQNDGPWPHMPWEVHWQW